MDDTAYPHLSNTGNVNSYNVSSSYNRIVNVNKVIADENPEMMQWLSPLDPRRRHQDVRTDRLDGVGNWLLEANEFRQWRSNEDGADKAVLFCCGNPGVGKTYLSSLVIDDLCDGACKEDAAIAMFYCDFRDQKEQTATDVMGAILKQLIVRGEVLEHVQKAFQKAKKEVGGRGLRLPDIVQMLKQTVAALPRVFICIDALDECFPKHLLELLKSLKDILQGSPRVRIFLTGRPQAEAEITRSFTTGVTVPISPKAQDIKNYLEKKLEMDTEHYAMSDRLRADIQRIILEQISEIFLLVSLNIDAILGEVTISARRQKLNEMTRGNHLGDAYATTLDRMKTQKGSRSRLGMEALMWVSNSERPLKTIELCHALGVKMGSPDLDLENVPEIRTILASSLGLITVEASSDTVRLVHITLQEYLSNNPSLFQSAHSMIAEVCLTYLNFRCVRELSPTLLSAPPTVPFVEYAACYWGKHMRREMTENATPLALRLLIGFEKHISSSLLLLHYGEARLQSRWRSDWGHCPKGFTGLHGAAFLGLEGIIATLLGMREWDINARDDTGGTAVAWAAIGGYEDVVKLLLELKDVDYNAVDTQYGRTPLWWASEGGHEGIVRLLLEREEINPNTADTEYGRTPLWWAAQGGFEGIIKLLLERKDINPNTTDTYYGATPLWWAAQGRHEGIVKLLLEREDIDLNTADTKYGQAPLWWAAQGGHEGIVRLLLEREEINPNTADTKYGRTPLCWAAEGGHEVIVKLLLEKEDISLNTADTEYGRTPLLWAVMGRHEGIVKLLLDRDGIDPNSTEPKYSQTPLLWAAEGEHEGIVKLLLEREDINPNTFDTEYGRTPLLWATHRQHQGIIKLLLERGNVNPNTVDTRYGGTPLWWAAHGGYEGIVKLLLEREDINANTADTLYGRTPLLWATEGGCEGIVMLLLEREGINPNTADTQYGQTPLWWAARGGNQRVVKLLLGRGDVNPNTADTEYGRTPLLWAAQAGYEGIVRLLLEREDIHINTVDTRYGGTPLWWAAQDGHERVVKLLLEREDINPNIADSLYGRTPLLWAAEGGHEGVVKLLLERGDLNPNIPSLSGETALELAARWGHTGAVGLLSEPYPPLPVLVEIDQIPDRPPSEPSNLLQSPSRPISSPSLSPLKPLPPDTRPLFRIAASSFMIISSSILLFYFLCLISPSLSTISLLSFSR